MGADSLLNSYFDSITLKELMEQGGRHPVIRKAIADWVGRSWYKGSETYQAPNFTTEPEYTCLLYTSRCV